MAKKSTDVRQFFLDAERTMELLIERHPSVSARIDFDDRGKMPGLYVRAQLADRVVKTKNGRVAK